MRNRFFVIILSSLIAGAFFINFVHVHFFESQRLKRIDNLITDSSANLLASPAFLQSVRRPETMDSAISSALQGTRIGKVFILRDADSKILYQSINVSHLKAELPIHPEWVAVDNDHEHVRVHNILLPGEAGRVMQVGLVLDRIFSTGKLSTNE